jgi:hypothetical protein
MKALTLFLRSREIPAGMLWAVPCMAVVAWLGTGPSGSRHAVTAAALALALGTAILSHSLGGPDSVLDATAAIPWPPRRATHLITIFLVTATVVTAVTTVPITLIVRDAAGLTGLAALAATLFGRRLAWTLPIVTGCVSAGIPAAPEPFVLHLLTWAGQPVGSKVAFTTATLFAVVGAAAYVTRGPSRRNVVG